MRGPVRRPVSRREALEAAERMMRDALGLRLLLGKLPEGATLDDARELRKQILQRGRRPSRVMAPAAGTTRA